MYREIKGRVFDSIELSKWLRDLIDNRVENISYNVNNRVVYDFLISENDLEEVDNLCALDAYFNEDEKCFVIRVSYEEDGRDKIDYIQLSCYDLFILLWGYDNYKIINSYDIIAYSEY